MLSTLENIQEYNWCNRIRSFIFNIDKEEKARIAYKKQHDIRALSKKELDDMIDKNWKKEWVHIMGGGIEKDKLSLHGRLDTFLSDVNSNLVKLYGEKIISLAGITDTDKNGERIKWNDRELGYPLKSVQRDPTETKLGWTQENCRKLEELSKTNPQLTWTEQVDRLTLYPENNQFPSVEQYAKSYSEVHIPSPIRSTIWSENKIGENPIHPDTEYIDFRQLPAHSDQLMNKQINRKPNTLSQKLESTWSKNKYVYMSGRLAPIYKKYIDQSLGQRSSINRNCSYETKDEVWDGRRGAQEPVPRKTKL